MFDSENKNFFYFYFYFFYYRSFEYFVIFDNKQKFYMSSSHATK